MDALAGARRVSVPSERLARWLDGFAERHGLVLAESGADVVTFTGADGARAWIEVAFPPLLPPAPAAGDPGEVAARLVEHSLRRRRIGVLLVRRGGYAAGVFLGADLIDSKVGSSYVQGTTKAGGWSQQRYARRRSNQAQAAFAEAADVAVRVLLPALAPGGSSVGPGRGPGASNPGRPDPVRSGLDAVVTGGDRAAVASVLDDPRLAALKPLVTGPLLQVPDPRLRVLQATPDQFLAVRISLDP